MYLEELNELGSTSNDKFVLVYYNLAKELSKIALQNNGDRQFKNE